MSIKEELSRLTEAAAVREKYNSSLKDLQTRVKGLQDATTLQTDNIDFATLHREIEKQEVTGSRS